MSTPDAATVAAVEREVWRHAMARPDGEPTTWCVCLRWSAGRCDLETDQRGYNVHLAAALLAAEPIAQALAAVIDAAHIEHQRAWSTETFGPREVRGPAGPLAHIRKEVKEVAADPSVLEEWVDVIILAFDGAWRAGHEPQAIIDAVKAKQAKNEARTWPDWRGVPADQAIEHTSCGFHAWGPDDRCITCGDLRAALKPGTPC